MKYSVTFPEKCYLQLTRDLFSDLGAERAAYLLCKTSKSRTETRLLVREVLPVASDDILSSSKAHMSIRSSSFMRAMKIAERTKHSFVFVHSHPSGVSRFSHQDDMQEAMLFRTAYLRISTSEPHCSLVFASKDDVEGRVWLEDGSSHALETIRVIGSSFKFLVSRKLNTEDGLFDRQVKAFGPNIQTLLRRLRIGIVGVGGTGSAVAEQLIRLGIGHLLLLDADVVDRSNLTRIYGSYSSDVGKKKVEVIKEHAYKIGIGTEVVVVGQNITFRSVAERLRECDIVFGCTDDEWGRSILCRLAIYYYIPVLDMGVRINSDQGSIVSVQGRVTVLMPGTSCLLCRKRVGGNIAAEVIRATNPSLEASLRKEGYIPELDTAAPAVIPFTTAVASSAVIELLQRLTAFMGTERESSEVLHLFDQTRIRTNKNPPDPSCFCDDPERIGRGDCTPFLDITWRPEN
ncbi:MAG: ThiF family adenylyltransferase [Candidatus Acidiferrales bacterium]